MNKNKTKVNKDTTTKVKTQAKASHEQYVYEGIGNERGEIFIFYFRTKERNKQALKTIGNNIAQGWGAMCESVKPFLTYEDINEIYDYDNRKIFR
jgi:hypothetical protein